MNEPMRVIQGNTLPYEPFWNIRDSKDGEGIEVEFDGPISEYSWWGDEVTPAAFKKELYEKGQGKPVTVTVNSPGGEVIAASVIRSILQEYPGQVTADIVGIAASAATIVITGADHIRMRDSALMMIHDPSALAYGSIDEIKQLLGVLETVKTAIIDTYQAKTGRDRDELARMMKKETWMTAKEAHELGFVDEVVTGSVKKAPASKLRAGFLNCLQAVPEEIKALIVDEEPENTENVPGEAAASAAEEPAAEEAGDGQAADIDQLRNYVEVFGPRKGGE